MSVNFKQLRVAVREAAQKSFGDVRAAHADEHFYAFALYTDDGAMTIMPASNTEEGFRRKAGPQPKEANYYRWATGEWAYEAAGADAFQRVYDLLNAGSRYDGPGSDGETAPDFPAFKNQVIETMISALGELDASGFFGSGTTREQVTLFVSISDSEETTAVEDASAQCLNPASVAERFAQRFRSADPSNEGASPCPYCGRPLRTTLSKQCRFCRRDWHDPLNVRLIG